MRAGSFGQPASKPHVVFTLVDDWGYELWPRGATHAQLLPQIRTTFVADGVELARHYTYSYCAPSRQSLLSGRQRETLTVALRVERRHRGLGLYASVETRFSGSDAIAFDVTSTCRGYDRLLRHPCT